MIEYKNRIDEALEIAADLNEGDKSKVERLISKFQKRIKGNVAKLNRLKLEINEDLENLEDLVKMLMRLEGDSLDIEVFKELLVD